VTPSPQEGASSQEGTKQPTAQSRLGSIGRRPQVRVAAIIAFAIACGAVVWFVSGGDNSRTKASVRAVSAQDLARLPATVHHPVYWAGPKRGFTYELTETNNGRIFIRYLPVGVSVGANQPKYLTIGTYPVKNAPAAVRAIAKRVQALPVTLSGGGVAVQDTQHPTSVYVAYPGSDYQVEVFDPSPARAEGLVLAGGVSPIASVIGPTQSANAAPASVTTAGLRELAASVGHPVYWAGPEPGTTYERTHTSDGRIYIRYLPSGVKAGDPHPHTTVGTYPFRDAVGAVKAIAKETGARTFTVAGGALAVVYPTHPTSVYLAFPGSNFQIEVFDPAPARARQLVTSGRIAPVR
jgi:HAMP domain-containing protein